jgi:hypothetical protein
LWSFSYPTLPRLLSKFVSRKASFNLVLFLSSSLFSLNISYGVRFVISNDVAATFCDISESLCSLSTSSTDDGACGACSACGDATDDDSCADSANAFDAGEIIFDASGSDAAAGAAAALSAPTLSISDSSFFWRVCVFLLSASSSFVSSSSALTSLISNSDDDTCSAAGAAAGTFVVATACLSAAAVSDAGDVDAAAGDADDVDAEILLIAASALRAASDNTGDFLSPFGVNGDSDSGADACADAADTDVGDNDSDSDANVGDFLFATDNSFTTPLSIRPCAASITAFLMRSLDLDFARVVRCALTPLWCISRFFSIIF